MNISDKRKKIPYLLKNISAGEVFESIDSGAFYMKTNMETTKAGEKVVGVVNLQNGYFDYFSEEVRIYTITGTFKITK